MDGPASLRRFQGSVFLLVPALTGAAIFQALFLRDQARALVPEHFAALACALAVQGAAALAAQLILARTAATDPEASVAVVARRAMQWGGAVGAGIVCAAWPAAWLLRLPSALPIALSGALLACYAPFAVWLGALQGARRFGWFGGLVLVEAALRWPAAAALRHAGVPGATAAVSALLAIYVVVTLTAAAAAHRVKLVSAAPAAPVPAAGFVWSVAASVASLGILTYADLFAVQAARPGAAGGSAYGAASALGRAVPMVLLPFAVALYPAVVRALAEGGRPWILLRRSLLVGGVVMTAVVLAVSSSAWAIVDLLFPRYPEAVWLVRWMPVATAPLGFVSLLAVYGLACGRRVDRLLVPACLGCWVGFAAVGGDPAGVLTVLGGIGTATALGLGMLAWSASRVATSAP